MAFDKVKRNRYYDPPFEFPHSSRNHAEDLLEFHIPLERMHNSALHDWGIAQGLEVTGVPGDTKLTVAAGVVIVGNGQLVCLSTSGQGDIGANPLATPPQSNPVAVPVDIPLAGYAGQTVYVTIQHSEVLRAAEGSGGRMEQVPWIRFRPAAGADAYVDDGTAVILAIVRVTAGGAVDWLRNSDASMTYPRRLVGQTVTAVRLARTHKTGNVVDDTVAGTVAAGADGGLELRVPNGGESITLMRDGNQNFSSLVARANVVTVKDSLGRDVLTVTSSNGEVTIGSNGREGNLTIKDSSGRNTLHFDANTASLFLGANGNEGDLSVRDAAGNEAVRISGLTGVVNTHRLGAQSGVAGVIDVDARFLRIHGWDLCLDGRSGRNNRALVDANDELVINWDNDYRNGVRTPGLLNVQGQLWTRGNLMGGNPARYVRRVWLRSDNDTVTEEVDLLSARQVFAFVAMTGCDPRASFDSGDAFAFDIFQVDGTKTGPWRTNGEHWGPEGDDSNVYAQTFTGTARRILFRARSVQDATVYGIGVVFHE